MRDVAIEPRVARAIHFAHAASAEGGDNLVRTEARASGQGHESGLILVVAPRRAKEKHRALTRHPALSQELPADQRAPEREERLVDVRPLVIPHAQAAKLTEPGKCALTLNRLPSRGVPVLDGRGRLERATCRGVSLRHDGTEATGAGKPARRAPASV